VLDPVVDVSLLGCLPVAETRPLGSKVIRPPGRSNFCAFAHKSEVCPPPLAVFEFGFECLEDGDTIAIERQGAAVAFYEGGFSNWMI
jgi:hypothetical protein